MEKVTGEEAERLGLERLYHRIRADEETGIRLFQETAEELVRYRLVNRLRALLNDVNTYPLERESSKLWREYYNARLVHLEGRLADAEKKYRDIAHNVCADTKLKAYSQCDLGDILSNFEYLKRPEGFQEAETVLKQSTTLGIIDSKIASAWLSLAWVYRRFSKWDSANECVERALRYYEQTKEMYMKIVALTHALSFYALR